MDTPYADAAKGKFDLLLKTNGDYWKTANAFDTMIDYVAEIDPARASDAARVISDRYKAFEDEGLQIYWYDDFGWWVVAAGRVVENDLFSSSCQNTFEKILSDCWTRMSKGTEVCTLPAFKDFQPVHGGGIWNGPERDSQDTFMGIQNTVTNVLRLIGAQRLGLEDAAGDQFTFLSNWFNDKTPERSLWWKLALPGEGNPDAALIRERASYYQSGEMDPGFQQHWVWTGDQGLILHAFVERYAQMNPDPSVDPGPASLDLMVRAKQIIRGARYYLVDSTNVLENWNDNKSFGDYRGVPSKYEYDYSTGTGVFWRNVLYAWNNNYALKNFIPGELKFVLQKSADKARNAASTQFWDLTNDLAVLTAAHKILT
jgi:hypothetical protein